MSGSVLLAVLVLAADLSVAADTRPNILVAISDDQSWVHASAYGYEAINTPAFDRVAREGALFTQGFSPTPGCSPTRAAFLTGRHSWMIEHAGTHASSFPRQYPVWPDTLERSGYVIGATGKLWGPGNWEVSGWERNPYGVHMPLAIMWPARMPGGRVIDDLIGFVDITATLLDVAAVAHPSREYPLSGRSFPTPPWALQNPGSIPRQDWLEERRPKP